MNRMHITPSRAFEKTIRVAFWRWVVTWETDVLHFLTGSNTRRHVHKLLRTHRNCFTKRPNPLLFHQNDLLRAMEMAERSGGWSHALFMMDPSLSMTYSPFLYIHA